MLSLIEQAGFGAYPTTGISLVRSALPVSRRLDGDPTVGADENGAGGSTMRGAPFQGSRYVAAHCAIFV